MKSLPKDKLMRIVLQIVVFNQMMVTKVAPSKSIYLVLKGFVYTPFSGLYEIHQNRMSSHFNETALLYLFANMGQILFSNHS